MPSSADAGPVRHSQKKAKKPKKAGPTIDALKADLKGFVMRYRTALMLQLRVKQGKPFTNMNRGTLQGTLRLLYSPEEVSASSAMKKATEKARRKLQEQAAMEAQPTIKVAFQTNAAPASTVSETAVEALVAARAAEAASLQPIPLANECNVCYSTFNTRTPTESEGEDTILRCHLTLCGHSSICSDCFMGYLANRVASDDVLPFLPCPHPDCKLPIAADDLIQPVPTPDTVRAFEKEYARLDAQRVERNQAAWDAMHAGALQLDAGKTTHTHKSKRARRASVTNKEATSSASSSPKKEATDASSPSPASTPAAAAAPAAASSSSSSSSAENSSEDDGDWSEASTPVAASKPSTTNANTSSIPVAPPATVASAASSSSAWSTGPAFSSDQREYLLPTPLLLRLILTHQSKLLARCKEWLPCGTFLKKDGQEDGQATEAKKADADEADLEEKKQDDTPAAAAPSETSVTPVVAATVDSSSDAATAPTAATATTATPAPASTLAPSCVFGFLLVPPFYTPYSHKLKLKKCDHCNLLQEVKLKEEADHQKLQTDPEVDKMIADGTLRPCPICALLTMKDVGMCNVMQCAGCSIWWNWASRATGKSQSALKESARYEGSLWEPGELAYQQRLQREDPEAFRALLAKNGIEYNPNYVRGSG